MEKISLTREDTDTFYKNKDGNFIGLNLKKTNDIPSELNTLNIGKPELIRSDIQEYRWVLKNRFQAATQRYIGLEEYMEVPDMDLWMKLKEEIIYNTILQPSKCAKIYPYPSDLSNIIPSYDSSNESKENEENGENGENEEGDYDYDDYSMDSIDKEEARRENYIDKLLCSRRYFYDSD